MNKLEAEHEEAGIINIDRVRRARRETKPTEEASLIHHLKTGCGMRHRTIRTLTECADARRKESP